MLGREVKFISLELDITEFDADAENKRKGAACRAAFQADVYGSAVAPHSEKATAFLEYGDNWSAALARAHRSGDLRSYHFYPNTNGNHHKFMHAHG